MIKKQLGGNRLGSGGKMEVSMHEYGKSTHNLSRIRRTSMTIGTLVPMGTWVLLTGDKGRLNLDALITTNALKYQLYGSMKFQLDVFTARMALYQPKMLLNLNDAGLEIADIKFPQIVMEAAAIDWGQDPTNQQINPSCIYSYLGYRGLGKNAVNLSSNVRRYFNGMPVLMYNQIYKEYYANKQEEKGVIIHNTVAPSKIIINKAIVFKSGVAVGYLPQYTETSIDFDSGEMAIMIEYQKPLNEQIDTNQILIQFNNGTFSIEQCFSDVQEPKYNPDTGLWLLWAETWPHPNAIAQKLINNQVDENAPSVPELRQFDLNNIDKMQMQILANVNNPSAMQINENSWEPYNLPLQEYGGRWSKTQTQEGLLIKTYQSDIFNNWLNTEWIDNITNRTKVQTDSEGDFTIDSLLITQKAWNYLNRVAAAGGTLDDWREVTYAHRSTSKSLKPIYEGGLSKEILFDMVVSTASTADEPLGSIASRGQFGGKHKGGEVHFNVDEESYLMVIASITPRIVYTQGNRWDVNLRTLDDLHKPEFDRIGFQNLITDQMAYWETFVENDEQTLTTRSAGKQPAWMWYKTDYDDALGNMASTEDYKVLGRSYDWDVSAKNIADLTTYIDPTKFNDIFAISSLDAQNFDVQVAMDLQLRRVISAEAMPNM